MKSTTSLLNIHYTFITSSFLPLPIPQPCKIMPIVLIKYVLIEPEDQLILGFTLGGGTEKGEVLDFPMNRKRKEHRGK